MDSDFRILLLLIPFAALLIAGIVILSRAHRRPSRQSARRAVFGGVGLVLIAALSALVLVWLILDSQLLGRIGVTIATVAMLYQILALARRQLARADLRDDAAE